ncbi:MAG: Fe-S cluster assembly ATPase SufC [bacterium]|nr:Fe-S cluster assembly ATPase SufC [bacterium]
MSSLQIKNLKASIGNTKILNGVSLVVNSNETHIIMGQNGSGKSTLLSVIMGHPRYGVTSGSITIDKKDLLKMSVTERAQAGIFLGFQHPQVVSGVTLGNFLRLSHNSVATARDAKAVSVGPAPFANIMRAEMEKLKMDPAFISRFINDGFSGGEKKKSEILQMALLKPAIAFLDEIDSGLDMDALKTVATELVHIQKKQGMALVIVSHNPKILEFIEPDVIHIMSKGKIVAEGGKEIVRQIEQGGYDALIKE